MRIGFRIATLALEGLSSLACGLACPGHAAPARTVAFLRAFVPGYDSPDQAHPRVLDRVIAAVNNQVILESDLELELRLGKLIPITDRDDMTPLKGLERLITRALIEQQIVQEDPHGLEVTPKDLQDSLVELRQRLPACRHRDCVTDAGWKAYLASMSLTPERVSAYWAARMAVLRFIEQRFRSGIRIAPEEIERYYREHLVPQYSSAAEAPALDQVSQRIQEILLQQRVNALLNDWLKSLQDQGQVEILEPSLRAAEPAPSSSVPASEKSTTPDTKTGGGV